MNQPVAARDTLTIRRPDGPARPDARPGIRATGDAQPRIDAAPRSDLRPNGVRAIIEAGLGPTDLPDSLQLVPALEQALQFTDRADRAAPGLSRLVSALIRDEIAKINRFMDLHGQ